MPTDRQTPLPDSIALYLREIGQAPLLSAAEEVALAQRIAEGDTAAAAALAAANLRLVIMVARRYRHAGIAFEDLIAEGNLGLLRAVEKYDWRRGHRFSTYAVWWIRQAIVRGLSNTAQTIRLPVYVQEQMRAQDAALQELASALEREPTDEEIAAHLGPQRERSALAVARQMAMATASLDQLIGDEGETPLAHLIPDTAQLAPDERAVQRALSAQMQEIMQDVLSDRQRTVLMLRFGLDGGDRKTLAEVAQALGKTRERIRQIETRALGKLRDALEDADVRSA